MSIMEPFWPRRSPHFLACRQAVRPWEVPAVIGLSGGPDSLALVAAAVAEGKQVEAVVVDHGIQPNSAEIAERAAQQARALNVTASVVAVRLDQGNVEAQAREARYAALEAAAGPARDIWVAHTAEDQAETLLLGALRGNPTGMPPRRGRLVRPLLGVRRADTVGACEELGLLPWHDPMNEDATYRRVAVRTQVLPLLEEIVGGEVVPALAKTAGRIAEDRLLLERPLSPSVDQLDCVVLGAEPASIRKRLVTHWLHAQGVAVQGAHVQAIDRLVTHWSGQGPVEVGGGRQVVRANHKLIVQGGPTMARC